MKKLIEFFNRIYVSNILIAIFISLLVFNANNRTSTLIFLAFIAFVLNILNVIIYAASKVNGEISLKAIELNSRVLEYSERTEMLLSAANKFISTLISSNQPYEVSTLIWAIKEIYGKNNKIMKRNNDTWKDKYVTIENDILILHQINKENISFIESETFTEDILAKDWIIDNIN